MIRFRFCSLLSSESKENSTTRGCFPQLIFLPKSAIDGNSLNGSGLLPSIALSTYNTARMVYFDYAANYPLEEEVLSAFSKAERERCGNANSLHTEGRKSLALIEEASKKILSLLGCDENEYEVIFTSGATESNNLAIKGVYRSYSGKGRKIIASEFEHSSVNAPLSSLLGEGAEVELFKSCENGKIDLSDLEKKATRETILTCLSYVEDELGGIQPAFEAQKIIKARTEGFLLLDATQAIGKIPCNFGLFDLISFSPHKFGGIIGTGVLIKRKAIVLSPLLNGGSSISIYRSGTPATGLIASVAKALEIAISKQKENFETTLRLRDLLLRSLSPDKRIKINSFAENPFIVNLSLEGKRGEDIVSKLDEKGFEVSHKAACSIGNTPSKAIMSVYHDKSRAKSSFRISLCSLTKEEDVLALGKAIKEVSDGK